MSFLITASLVFGIRQLIDRLHADLFADVVLERIRDWPMTDAVEATHWEAVVQSTQNETGVIVLGVVAFLLGFLLMYLGARRFQTGRLIKNTAPERVRSVAVGRTELRGIARDAGVTFDRPFTDGKCLYYSYEIEQYEKERVQDDDGGTKTERSWNTTSSHSLAAPFHLEDETGEILVAANGGANFQISDEYSFSETFDGRSIPGKYKKSVDTSVDIADAISEDLGWSPHNLSTKIEAKIPFVSIPGTSNDVKPRNSGSPLQPDYSTASTRGQILKRRISQTVLPVDEDVYVYGAATMRPDPMGSNEQRLIIQGDDATGRFIVSDQGEKDLARSYTLWGLGFLLLGLLVSALGLGILVSETSVALVVVSLRRFV